MNSPKSPPPTTQTNPTESPHQTSQGNQNNQIDPTAQNTPPTPLNQPIQPVQPLQTVQTNQPNQAVQSEQLSSQNVSSSPVSSSTLSSTSSSTSSPSPPKQIIARTAQAAQTLSENGVTLSPQNSVPPDSNRSSHEYSQKHSIDDSSEALQKELLQKGNGKLNERLDETSNKSNKNPVPPATEAELTIKSNTNQANNQNNQNNQSTRANTKLTTKPTPATTTTATATDSKTTPKAIPKTTPKATLKATPSSTSKKTSKTTSNQTEFVKLNSWLQALRCLLHEHHYPVSEEEIYQLSDKSGNVELLNEQDIEQICGHFRLKPQWKKVSFKQLSKTELPALAVLKDGTAVALESVGKDRATIKVISNNRIRSSELKLSALQQQFSGKLLVLQLDEDSASDQNRLRISEWIDRKTLSFSIFEVILASLMINLFQIALPLYTMNVYDKVVPNQSEATLWVLFSGILLILVLDYIFRILRSVILENISERVGEALEVRLFRKSLTSNVTNQQDVGAEADLLHEMSNYRAGFFGKTFVDLIEFPFFFLFFAIIYGISPEIAYIPLVAALLVAVINLLHHFPIYRISKELFSLRKVKESFVIQSLSGRESLRLANGFSRYMAIWQATLRRTLALGRKSQLWNSSMMVTLPILVQAVSAVVIFVGCYQLFEGKITVGALVAATILSGRAILPILNFVNALTRLASSRHMLKAWKKVLTQQTDYDLSDNLLNKGHFKGNLLLHNVCFKYPNNPDWALDNISLEIKAGEKVGIVGPSGVGKSTLLRVLNNIEKIDDGTIQLDGYSVKDIHPLDLHRNISYMSQNPTFFSGTVKENIQLGSSHEDPQKIDEMVDFFGIHQLLHHNAIGGGLSFKVAEGGKNLSGGQRQLIALMRCLLTDAAVYVFDEPTTGMDGELEKRAMQYIAHTLKDKTIILVTHRFGLLQMVDRLVMLHQGKLVDDGPKQQMMEKYFASNS